MAPNMQTEPSLQALKLASLTLTLCPKARPDPTPQDNRIPPTHARRRFSLIPHSPSRGVPLSWPYPAGPRVGLSQEPVPDDTFFYVRTKKGLYAPKKLLLGRVFGPVLRRFEGPERDFDPFGVLSGCQRVRPQEHN